jgi:hypothetical protein
MKLLAPYIFGISLALFVAHTVAGFLSAAMVTP